MKTEMSSRTVYDVTYNGTTKTFDNHKEAYAYCKDCDRIERIKYMDKLGIPEQGLYLVWCNHEYTGIHPGVVMFNRKCVAHLSIRNGKKYMIYPTEWDRNQFIDWNDLLKNKEKYIAIWNSKFDRRDGAFRSHWGDEDDGAVDFDYYMGEWNTGEGVNIEKL